MSIETQENAFAGASEEWVDVTIRLPKRYTIPIFQADTTLDIDVETICPNGHTIVYLYGLGRKHRDGAQQAYEKDADGKVCETPEGKKFKSLAHAEARYADLQSGEIRTRVSGSGVPTIIRYLKKEVIRFVHGTLGVKVKDIPKLKDTQDGIKEYCDTLKGCPWDKILANATMQADMEDGIEYEVETIDVKPDAKKVKKTK